MNSSQYYLRYPNNLLFLHYKYDNSLRTEMITPDDRYF